MIRQKHLEKFTKFLKFKVFLLFCPIPVYAKKEFINNLKKLNKLIRSIH